MIVNNNLARLTKTEKVKLFDFLISKGLPTSVLDSKQMKYYDSLVISDINNRCDSILFHNLVKSIPISPELVYSLSCSNLKFRYCYYDYRINCHVFEICSNLKSDNYRNLYPINYIYLCNMEDFIQSYTEIEFDFKDDESDLILKESTNDE